MDPMKSYSATLYVYFDAHDEGEALEIAEACKAALESKDQPYKVAVDIPAVEEN
jgi:uncharacterized protein YecE (DUF72 family)